MQCLLPVTICLCMSFLAVHSLDSDAEATAITAKRSGEVIYFENKGTDDSMSKRSGQWAESKAAATDAADDDNTYKLTAEDKEVLDELEKWAFDEALDFLVDKLIAEAYQAELDGMYEYGTTEFPDIKPMPGAEHKVPAVPVQVPQSEDQTQEQFDDQADALASLIAKQNQRVSENTAETAPKIQLRADDSMSENSMAENHREDNSRIQYPKTGFPGFNPGLKLTMDNEDETDAHSSDNLQMGSAAEVEAAGEVPEMNENDLMIDDEDLDSYSIERMLEYFEYLQKLKNLEDSFRSEMADFRGEEKSQQGQQQGQQQGLAQADPKPLSRKRRSISDEWVDSRRGPGEGVCFDAEEAAELKELLLSLAKDRMILQELTNTMADEGGESSELNGGYPVTSEKSNRFLGSLAYRLSQQPEAPKPTYQQPKRYYDFNPYLYGGAGK